MPRINSINFYQNGPKVKLCQKNYLKLSSFSEKRNLLPDPLPPQLGASPSDPPNSPPHFKFLATRPGATGAYRGRAPPIACLCPPKRGLCPEEINWLGASEAQMRFKLVLFVD